MVLDEIQIEGFGPFAEIQRIALAPSGITVIYGDNMRGKTSLLNAIRYAFFGTVQGRSSRTRALHTLSNRDLAAAGRFGFSVALSFSHAGQKFELTRECRPKGGTPPSNDSDYNQTRRLRRGSQVLGPQECDHVLPSLFPEQVSRFFLFDGELLQEYEELLYDESVTGRKISESIEQILGVPLLRNARTHVNFVMEEAEREAAREASRHEGTKSIGTALQQATELRVHHRSERDRLQGQLADLQEERQDALRYLESVERYKALIEDREVAQVNLEDVNHRLIEIGDDTKDLMKDAWRTVLSEPVRRGLTQAMQAVKASSELVLEGIRKRAVDRGTCEICGHELDSEEKTRLGERISHLEWPEELTLGVSNGVRRLADLQKFRERNVEDQVRTLEKERHTSAINRVILTDRIREIETELADANTEEIESGGRSLREVEQKIVVVAQGITEQQEKISSLDQNIEALSRRLDAISPTDLKASQERSKLLRKASDVLIRAIEEYKNQLRERVQESATQLFLAMTTEESEYASLEINQSYGLNIVHTA